MGRKPLSGSKQKGFKLTVSGSSFFVRLDGSGNIQNVRDTKCRLRAFLKQVGFYENRNNGTDPKDHSPSPPREYPIPDIKFRDSKYKIPLPKLAEDDSDETKKY